jgi:hypothetical protein
MPRLPGTSLLHVHNNDLTVPRESVLTQLHRGLVVVALPPQQPDSGEINMVFRNDTLVEAGTSAELAAADSTYACLRRAWETGSAA